jgi:1-deoxy-D-xylulose-5-phosphate reductoisomerase
VKSLTFEKPDLARFPCLGLAYAALQAGGTAPAVLNAANEIAVEAFLAGRLAFTGIAGVIADTLAALPAAPAQDLAQIIEADARARHSARSRVMALAA